MKSILSAVIGATLALSAIEAGAQATPGERQVSLTIESTSLATALDKWAQQSGFQIFVQDWEATKNLRAPSLNGTFAAQDALEQLLSGTSLTYVWIDSKTVSIRKRVSQTVPTALQRTSLDGQQGVPVAKFSGDDVGAGTGAKTLGDVDHSDGDVGLRTERVAEVIVTGTYIRGSAPASSPLTTYTSKDIENSGATTLEAFLEKIPQNFTAVGSDTFRVNVGGLNAANNQSRGTAINLRGLGPGSTLVLLNGRRMAPAGGLGQFVDASLIPLSAIDRIEVLTDGASAIYGADAVGGVVNFIMRTDFNGVEATVRNGGDGNGDARELGGSLLAGAASDDGYVSFVYDGLDQDGLDASRRSFIPDQGGPFRILPSQQRNSFLLSGRRSLTDSIAVYADVLQSKRAYEQDATQLGFPALILSRSRGDVSQSNAVAGLSAALGAGWMSDLSGTYSENEEVGTSAAEGFPTSIIDTRSRMRSLDAHLDGPIGSIGGGTARASLILSYRDEEYEDIGGTNSGGKSQRKVASAAGEVLLPFVTAANAHPGIHRLELSMAARYDDYDDFGSSINPKVGLLWSPFEGLNLRTSYTQSFRAPPLGLLGEVNPFGFQVVLQDPAAPDLQTNTLIFSTTGNAELKPETSEAFTVGFDVTPTSIEGLAFSATYFSIDYKDRIALPPIESDLFSIFQQSTPLTPYIDFDPSAAAVADIYARTAVFDTTGLGPDGVEAIFYLLPQNVARSRTSGAQGAVSYDFAALGGRLGVFLSGDFLFESRYTPVVGAASAELLDRIYNPPRYRLRSGASLSRNGLTASLGFGYVPSYPNDLLSPAEKVSSWLTADARVAYRFDENAKLAMARNLELAIAVDNVTDADPPRVRSDNSLSDFGYDPTNASPLGRFISVSLRKTW